ncbi:MAG: hypothetical protein AB1640_03690 [bacterium]
MFASSRAAGRQEKKDSSMPNENMKKEYDFSSATRGKFFRPGLRLRLPVYLDEEALAFVQRIARKKKTDVSSVVNQLIISNKHLAEVID